MKKPIVIIGLDGVPYSLLKDLSDSGVMPCTRKLIAEGVFRKMSSSIPEISSVAWSSIITGKNPAEHGIFGFTDVPKNSYRLSFPNFSQLAQPAFWETDSKGKYVIINVPSTYPARSLNGFLISGFVALDLEKAVYPNSLVPQLKKIDYRIDVDAGKAHKSIEFFIKDLKKTTEARIAAYRYLWKCDWDVFMLVFTGTDRLMHFLWGAYEDKKHELHHVFKDYFSEIDQIIGEIASRAEEKETSLAVISDHGFEKLEKDAYVNRMLEKAGLLKFTNGKEPALNNMASDSKAFALDPGRIYVHSSDRYPAGSVSEKDKSKVINEIEDFFKTCKIGGKNAIKRVYRKEEIYKGDYFNHAPDLVLLGNKGINLKATINAQDVFSKDIFTGKHTQDDAFLLVREDGAESFIPNEPNVCDFTKIINCLRGGKCDE